MLSHLISSNYRPIRLHVDIGRHMLAVWIHLYINLKFSFCTSCTCIRKLLISYLLLTAHWPEIRRRDSVIGYFRRHLLMTVIITSFHLHPSLPLHAF